MRENVWDEALATVQKEMLGNIDYLLAHPLLDKYLEGMEIKEGQKILEPGAGSGLDSLLCAKKYGVEPYLLDFSESSHVIVKKLGEILGVTYKFIFGDCRALPFEANTFDVVWNNGVNEHFDGNDRQKVFDEMSRVCKERGYVLVVVPNSWDLFYRLKKKAMERRGIWPFGFEKPFSPIELVGRVKKAGLRVIRYDACGFLSSISGFFKIGTGSSISCNKIEKDNDCRTAGESLLSRVARYINRSRWINCFCGSLIIVVGKKE